MLIKVYRNLKCVLGLHDYSILKKTFIGNVHRAHLICTHCKKEFYGVALDTERAIGFVRKITPEDRMIGRNKQLGAKDGK